MHPLCGCTDQTQIESLPTRSESEPPLQNVLSISTAGKNRYLFHFNSHHSLVQWTAGIRLAMFEHATLQEAYTGALIAGKGKALNNINLIMDRTRVKTEDWARVRFGAGTPWRRCWCVITPPDEKEVARVQKQANKKKSAYDRSRPPAVKGNIKFYDSKKTKKATPIATITDAYSAFAIYPQAKPLIDASTLVKVEGSIMIHSDLPSKSEGFVFVMPEAHPAVSGFEIMLRWLFPVFDTFALYGRPGRLIADTTDTQSLMFAMPKRRRYGYLETLDVAQLISQQGSSEWKESEWRRRMKDMTSERMTKVENGSQPSSRYSSRKSTRNSFGPSRTRIQFDDNASVRSSPHIGRGPSPQEPESEYPRTDSTPPSAEEPAHPVAGHYRSASETQVLDRFANAAASYDGAYEQGPPPPPHSLGLVAARYTNEMGSTPERVSSEDEMMASDIRSPGLDHMRGIASPEPVVPPPAFSHSPGALPSSKPWHSPELRRANSRMSTGTLSQLVVAAGASGAAAAAAYRSSLERSRAEEQGIQGPTQYPLSPPLAPGALVPKPYPAHVAGTYQPSPQFSQPAPPPIYSPPVAPSHSAAPIPAGAPHQRTDPSQTPITAQLAQLLTSPGVLRKPLPTTSPIVQSPTSASSSGSLGEHILDQAAFNMIGSPLERKHTFVGKPERSDTTASVYPEDIQARLKNEKAPPMPAMPDPRHRGETATSVYPEDVQRRQTLEPAPPMPPIPAMAPYSEIRDRANTDDSVYEDDVRYDNGSTEGRRTGVLRTVGNVQTQNDVVDKEPNPLIPHVDFGPTYNLAAGAGPRQQSPGRGPSPVPAQPRRADRSPAQRSPAVQSHSRSPSRPMIIVDNAHYRSPSAEGRTIPWQPGMSAVPLSSPNTALTAEEFVQQRAAAAVPLYAHQRQNSGNVLGRNTPPPPLGGPQAHSRHSSVDLLQRPRSRGASVALTQKQQQAQYQQYPEQMADYRAPQPNYGIAPQYLQQAPYVAPSIKVPPLVPIHGGALAPAGNKNLPPTSPLYSPPPPQFFTTPQFLSQRDEPRN
jgi:CCR4-NOT transcriptional complex subunit CAF120